MKQHETKFKNKMNINRTFARHQRGNGVQERQEEQQEDTDPKRTSTPEANFAPTTSHARHGHGTRNAISQFVNDVLPTSERSVRSIAASSSTLVVDADKHQFRLQRVRWSKKSQHPPHTLLPSPPQEQSFPFHQQPEIQNNLIMVSRGTRCTNATDYM